MKKVLFAFFISSWSISLFAIPSTCIILPDDPRTADQILSTCGAGTVGIDPSYDSTDKDSVRRLVTTIANTLITLGGLLAVGALVWSGIQYTKAYGDDEKLKKSKSTALYAIIGLILVMASFGLVDIFINFIYRLAGQG